MFKINRKIEYALIALRHINAKDNGTLTSAKEICEVYGTPFDPTSRVLQIMAQNRVLEAIQGAKGGYKLASSLETITMRELSAMIAGPIEIANCFHGDYSACEISCTCQIIAPMLNLNENINRLFAKITIADLLSSEHEKAENIRSKDIAAEAALKA